MRACLVGLFLIFGTNSFGQTIQIKDIQFRQGHQLSKLSNESFRFMYRIKSRDINYSLFRKIDFSSRLEMLDTTIISLWGNYELLGTTSNKTHTASLFGSSATSSLLIHFIDNQTDAQVSYPLQIKSPWKRRNLMYLYSSPESNSIFLLYKSDSRTWELQQLGLNGKPFWSRQFTDSKKINLDNINLLSGNNLSFVKVTHPGSRKAKNEIVVIDGSTGNDVYTHQLYDQNSKNTVDNMIVNDSLLYITGRKFFTNRVSHNETGLPFLRKIEGLQTSDIKLTSSLLNMKTYWMDVITNENGERYLIGETFTNESRGAYFMKGVITGLMTFGLFYVSWTTMKFEQVAIVPLDNSSAQPLSLVQLTPRKIQLGNYTPGYSFAAYSHKTGQVRYWGHDRAGNPILMDGGVIKRYNIQTRASEELGRLPENSSQQVIFTDEDYVIYLNQRKANNSLEFKALPLGR